MNIYLLPARRSFQRPGTRSLSRAPPRGHLWSRRLRGLMLQGTECEGSNFGRKRPRAVFSLLAFAGEREPINEARVLSSPACGKPNA